MIKTDKKILVAVICYNEEKNIAATIEDLQKNNFGFDIVVVDNASSDNTLVECKKLGVPYISHCVNSGGSVGTLGTYFMFAHRNQYDVLCQFDGDGQHVASELPKIINPVLRGEANCVIGSRFLTNEGFQSFWYRRLGIKFFSSVVQFLSGFPFTDITSGFRAYDKKIIRLFGLQFPDEFFDSINQFVMVCHYAGVKFQEAAVVMKPRLHGKSEFNFRNSVAFPIKSLICILGCVLQSERLRRLKVM